jgi:predicted component of type VI protein secretion system
MSQAPGADDRARLESVRDRLEAVLNDPDTAARDLAAVSREFRQTLFALGQLAPPEGDTHLDEIAARRRRRGAS